MSDKLALITGGTRGIGFAIALEFARNGYQIIITNSKSREEGESAESFFRNKNYSCRYFQADVVKEEEVKKLLDSVIDEFGRIDVLVNNAGIIIDKTIKNLSYNDWCKVIEVNLNGTFLCTREAFRHMKTLGHGKIINISSVIGEIGNIGQSNYSASKGGIISFTKSAAKEFARSGILVNAIAPGFIHTNMMENIPEEQLRQIINQIPLQRLGEPMEVAKLALFLASEDSNYITGQVFNINGGLYM